MWHGKSGESLERLLEIKGTIKNNEELVQKLSELFEYIDRNKKYIVNYQNRQTLGLPFTSTIAESTVNSLINVRQKDNRKMQWSRDGAHNVLQIRASRFSKNWESDWLEAQNTIYKKAA